MVNPPGAYKPSICAVSLLEPNGLKVEWVPPPAGTANQYRIYRKRYLESVFSRLDTASPAAGFWQSNNEQNLTAYDVVMTAIVNGPAGPYETDASPLTRSIFLRVDGPQAGFPDCNTLRWNAYEGADIPRYYIFLNDQLLDSVSGTQTQYQDCNPPANAVYRVEVAGTEDCLNSVTDIDGNVYQAVVIGTQEWMKENLKVSKYRNGDLISTNLDNTSWQNTTSGAYVIYDNNTANDSIYGKLYNWYAVADPRGLCPAGWHVPSDAEWTTLENFLGGASVAAGGKMKSTGTIQASTGLWQDPNTGATNSSGFTAFPGGNCDFDGSFNGIGRYGGWWSSTESASTNAWYRSLGYLNANSYRSNYYKPDGFSVRCLRD